MKQFTLRLPDDVANDLKKALEIINNDPTQIGEISQNDLCVAAIKDKCRAITKKATKN
jgi:CBS-domain-containing membrane protein